MAKHLSKGKLSNPSPVKNRDFRVRAAGVVGIFDIIYHVLLPYYYGREEKEDILIQNEGDKRHVTILNNDFVVSYGVRDLNPRPFASETKALTLRQPRIILLL